MTANTPDVATKILVYWRVAKVLADHVLYMGYTEDDAFICGCGITEPEDIQEANDPKATERWWAEHVAAILGDSA